MNLNSFDEISSRYNLVEGYISGPANTIVEANDIAKSFVEITK